KPVSNDIHDLIGIGDIYGRHEVDSFGVKTLLDDKGCLPKPRGNCPFQLVDRFLHRWRKGNRSFLAHYATPPLCRIAATNVRVRRSARLAWVALTSSGR